MSCMRNASADLRDDLRVLDIDSIEYTRFGNPTVRSALFLAPKSTVRNLKLKRVCKWYTDEEYKELITWGPREIKEHRFTELFYHLETKAKKAKKIIRWSAEEDAFLRANYQYLSDSVIALALNKPVTRVISRRASLKLKRTFIVQEVPFVIVWDKRSAYKKDLKKHKESNGPDGAGLTLLREGLV